MRVDDVLEILRTGQGVSYDGEAVDELSHALQCAALAECDGADEELVAAALLHDVGRAPQVQSTVHGTAHERMGAEFTRPLFGDRVAWLVGAHVAAKRYLVSVDQTYAAQLSPASVRSLVTQGGRFMAREVENFQAHDWWSDAVRLRRWDDLAKVAGAPQQTLKDLKPLLDRLASSRV
jgi:gamma-butyrobetaine dioxygenase